MWFCRGGHWPSVDLRRVHGQRTRNVRPCETANKNHSQPIEPARTNFPQGNFQRGGSVSASYSGTLWRGAGEPKRFTCRFFAALSSRRRKSHRFPRRAAERQIKQRVHTMHPYTLSPMFHMKRSYADWFLHRSSISFIRCSSRWVSSCTLLKHWHSGSVT